MSILVRRIIVIIFFIGFFIASPILIFYSSGYRYDFQKNKILKTGSFYFISSPDNAEIYLNNEYQNKTTPDRLLYKLPNDYNIRIEKQDYFSWSKKLKIESKLTTFADDIRLFPVNEPQLFVENKINIFELSPSKNILLYSINDGLWEELWTFNLNNKQKTLLYRSTLETELKFISWSAAENKILIQKKNNYFIIETGNSNTITDLSQVTNLKFSSLKWDTKNQDYLYGINNNNLFLIDIDSLYPPQKILTFDDFVIRNFLVKQSTIFAIKQNQGNTYLEKFDWDPNSQTTQKTNNIIKLTNADYEFQTCYNQKICFSDINTNEFFILEPDLKNIVQNITEVEGFDWKNNNLLHYNNFEIWSTDLLANSNNEASNLITRFGDQIKKAAWLPRDEYVVFLINNQIKIIELDKRDKQNIVEYSSVENISDFFVTKDGKNIIFLVQNNDLQGIYMLNIFEPDKE